MCLCLCECVSICMCASIWMLCTCVWRYIGTCVHIYVCEYMWMWITHVICTFCKIKRIWTLRNFTRLFLIFEFIIWLQHFLIYFLPSKSSYKSLCLPSKSWAIFDCYCMHVCICMYIHISKYNLISLYKTTCIRL